MRARPAGTRAPSTSLIVEDQREIREGLARLIDRAAGFRCVGRLSIDGGGACRRVPSDPPAVALLDIGLPGMSGIAGIEPLKARYPEVLVLMITVHDDDERIFEAMCAGACGYLLKKTPPEKLVESVREVVAGGAPMSPEIARRVVRAVSQVPATRARRLSPHAARIAAARHARRRPQLQNGCRGARRDRPRRVLPHASRLREAARALEVGGRGEGAALAALALKYAGNRSRFTWPACPTPPE